MNAAFIDTNIFLRYLTRDDEEKYKRCRRLFERVVKGEINIETNILVIAEVIWTLTSYFGFKKDEVIEKVKIILLTPNLKVENKEILIEALILYSRKNIDFIDAYNAVYSKDNKIFSIYSYDKDFENIDFIKRIEP